MGSSSILPRTESPIHDRHFSDNPCGRFAYRAALVGGAGVIPRLFPFPDRMGQSIHQAWTDSPIKE